MRALKIGSIAAAIVTAFAGAGCRETPPDLQFKVAEGDRNRAPQIIRHYGCGACHTIPGVPGASATVGPSLKGLRDRQHIAGRLPNTPVNLVRWIQHPREHQPGTLMPETGITEKEARHVAAYLYNSP